MNKFQKFRVEKKNPYVSHKLSRTHIRLFNSNMKREGKQKVDCVHVCAQLLIRV